MPLPLVHLRAVAVHLRRAPWCLARVAILLCFFFRAFNLTAVFDSLASTTRVHFCALLHCTTTWVPFALTFACGVCPPQPSHVKHKGFAADGGHTACVRLLLALDGIKTNEPFNNGETPLTVASRLGHTGVALLLTTPATLAQALDIAVASSGLHRDANRNTQLVRRLLSSHRLVARAIGMCNSVILHSQGFCFHGPGFATSTDDDGRDSAGNSVLLLTVDSADLVESTLATLPPARHRGKFLPNRYISVKYLDMEGIDEAGLGRDFVTRLAEALCRPELGLLDSCQVDGTWYHSPRADVRLYGGAVKRRKIVEQRADLRWLLGVVLGWSLLFHVRMIVFAHVGTSPYLTPPPPSSFSHSQG